jgi:hypothetical protein
MTARTPRLAAALATGALGAALLAGCGNGDDSAEDLPNTVPDSTSAAATSDAPSESASTPSGSPSEDAGGSGGTAAPAYFVGDTPLGPRLFREFHKVSATDPVDEALALLSSGDPFDDDYSSLLPSDAVPKAHNQDEGFAVEVPAAWATRPDGMSEKDAALAVQQIVFTVQGVLQDRTPVGFVDADGQPVDVFGLKVPDGGFTATEKDLALVNVTTPEEGQEVSGTFTAEGVANSFEATVPWEVRDESGAKVLDGFATAEGWADKLYPWKSDVDVSSLAPGTYTFVAMTDDPSEGEGGGPTEDSKTIVVK